MTEHLLFDSILTKLSVSVGFIVSKKINRKSEIIRKQKENKL